MIVIYTYIYKTVFFKKFKNKTNNITVNLFGTMKQIAEIVV